MTAVLLTTLVLLGVGVTIALSMPARPRTWQGLAGESYLLGTGAATLVLLALSAAQIRWSRISLASALAATAAVAVAIAVRRGIVLPVYRPLTAANAVDVITAALAGGHALLATIAPPIENDYLLIWGVKARRFLAAGGIDWSFLEAPLNVTAHPDYPLLVPLAYDVMSIVNGAWPEEWIGFVTFAFGASALLAVRGLLEDEMPRLARAVTTLILMPLLFSPYIGLAEGPLIALFIVGVLYVRRGVAHGASGEIARGAVFLGLAAWTKNEGLSLIAAVALAMIAAGAWRRLPMLWPAVAIPLPWLVLHRIHGLRVDLAAGGTAERLLTRLSDPLPIATALVERTGMPVLFWLGVACAVIVAFRRVVRDERFLASTTAIQLFVYAGVYYMTPRELEWHIETSWDRVLRQIMPLVALVAIMATAPVIASLLERLNAIDSRTDRAPGGPGAA